MKIIRPFLLLGSLLFPLIILSQSEGLTSSPYSLYGLGVINQTSIGKNNSMGFSGLALPTETSINSLNPSNYALIPQNSFFYDIGITEEFNTYANAGDKEWKNTLNFSNIAFAFRITERLGAGISLIPYSDVGYSLLGLVSNIEGSNESFESNVSGLGGLNDFSFNVGYGLSDSFRLGIHGSFLFGKIEETETFTINTSYFQLNETTNYSGLRIGIGTQFDITNNFTIGSTVKLPISLKGNLTRSVNKTLDGTETLVVDGEADSISDFKLPLELGFGFSTKIKESLLLSVDYKKNFWSTTNQLENIGSYSDQNIYAIGLEYSIKQRGFTYWNRMKFRAGFNYEDGYLNVNDNKIDGFTITAGLGLPMGEISNSMINLSYAYGSRGQIQNILVKENYHSLTINFSLEDLWFRDRKIN